MEIRELASSGLVHVFEFDDPSAPRGPAGEGRFDVAEIAVVRRGSFTFHGGGAPQPLAEGFALLGNPGQQFGMSYEREGGDRVLVFRFHEAALEGLLRRGPAREPSRRFSRSFLPPIARIEALSRWAERAATGAADASGLEELALRLAATVGFELDRTESDNTPAGGAGRAKIEAAMARIEARAGVGISLGELAREAGLSPFHFLRLFRRVAGRTPHQLLIQARLRRAMALLLDTARPVTEIAAEAGFFDLSNFINTFRRNVGCSPQRYRRSPYEVAGESLAQRFQPSAASASS
jgi:AraC-like DNA-binding protein